MEADIKSIIAPTLSPENESFGALILKMTVFGEWICGEKLPGRVLVILYWRGLVWGIWWMLSLPHENSVYSSLLQTMKTPHQDWNSASLDYGLPSPQNYEKNNFYGLSLVCCLVMAACDGQHGHHRMILRAVDHCFSQTWQWHKYIDKRALRCDR